MRMPGKVQAVRGKTDCRFPGRRLRHRLNSRRRLRSRLRNRGLLFPPPTSTDAPQPVAPGKRRRYLAALGILAAAGLAVALGTPSPALPPAPVSSAAAAVKNEKHS